jgi:hypothetical protein
MATTMTYNEWLAKQTAAANEVKTESIGAANKGYASALYNGALQQQMSAPTYGATAEALASRGMANSGYSNYLANNAQDTFNKTATVAQQTRDASIAGANKLYDKTMQAVNEEGAAMQKDAYMDFYNRIANGGTVDANGNYLEAPKTSDVQKAYDEGLLTKDYYDMLKEQMNSTFNRVYGQGGGFYDQDGLLLPMDTVKELLGTYETDAMLDDQTKTNVGKTREYLYTPYYNPTAYTSDMKIDANAPEFDENGYATIRMVYGNNGYAVDDKEQKERAKILGTEEEHSGYKNDVNNGENVRVKMLSSTGAEGKELERVNEVIKSVDGTDKAVQVGHFFYFNDNIYYRAGKDTYWKVDKDGDKANYDKIKGYIAQKLPNDYSDFIGVK